MEKADIGILGGSGLYAMDDLTERSVSEVPTPFGKPSGPIVFGLLGGRRVAFIARHGKSHSIAPGQINYRANIYALKQVGVRFIFAVSACGSLREAISPGHVVIPDQLVDFTRGQRKRSFFDAEVVAHVSVADPYCDYLRSVLYEASSRGNALTHPAGTFVTVEGPRFSTRAESAVFRSWNMDIIGMTTCPEAFLAREAEMSYAVLTHVTDYDVWRDETVTNDEVVRTFAANIRETQATLVRAVGMVELERRTPSHCALDGAVMTSTDALTPESRERYKLLLDRILK